MVRKFLIAACSVVLAAGLVLPSAARAQKARVGPKPPNRVSSERAGVLATRDGQYLKLTTDMGAIRVFTSRELPAGQMSYRVRIEADASQPEAQKLVEQFAVTAKSVPDGVQITGTAPWRRFRGRVLVNYEVSVPRRYNLEIQTQAGSISTEDIDGQVLLSSAGGNLTTGRVGGSARVETQGGHITVKEVAGNLQATTAGGHVNVGQVQGDAVLRSLGGHINATSVQGSAQLDTAGGNISLQRAGAGVTATTAGGRIDVGEASGAMRAKTAGGGIRVVKLAGPTQLETSGGSIYLTSVQGQVRAATAAGGITAWLISGGKLQGLSQLESGSGDIIVFIPRDLAITIEASVESDGDHRIEPEPGIPLKFTYTAPGPRPRVIKAEAALNGGGEVLRLKAQGGDIKLKFSDSYQAYYEKLYKSQMGFFEKSRELEKMLRDQSLRMLEQMRREQEEREQAQQQLDQARQQLRQREQEQRSRMEDWRLRVREKITGRINVDADVQSRKLVNKVKPDYPELARKNEIEGVVWLEVSIDKEGKVEEVNRIEGHPTLVQAAIEAVKQWRYSPTYLGDRPVAVSTVVRLEFRLN